MKVLKGWQGYIVIIIYLIVYTNVTAYCSNWVIQYGLICRIVTPIILWIVFMLIMIRTVNDFSESKEDFTFDFENSTDEE